MIEYSNEPVLVPLQGVGFRRMTMAVPALLNGKRWELGPTDEFTLLPTASKNDEFYADFFWCDAQGKEVEPLEATHLAVQVQSHRSGTEAATALEKQLLSLAIKDGEHE
jgi:hypothetical protein